MAAFPMSAPIPMVPKSHQGITKRLLTFVRLAARGSGQIFQGNHTSGSLSNENGHVFSQVACFAPSGALQA